ncbi:MAG: bifunctional adenosylcobinamide kinase/adenosylcobinamide-phosphate guanylyltransferase [Methylobacterium sp.]|nr:MAG: bifunctional adenosylcobinamide kinase/adenosylcobinamide-phosphate guanylyltransferase [Methylobacterium sp.]
MNEPEYPSIGPALPCSTLVLGGARSGKSGFAERLARESGLVRIYIATAQGFDEEMRARIARHKADRAGDGWETIEEPIALPDAIRREAERNRVLLVDCLTLWLSNVMLAEADVALAQAALLESLAGAKGPVILVSNEVGMGLVPETKLGRDFRDAQGRLNQAVALAVPRVFFVAAGLPITLKAP